MRENILYRKDAVDLDSATAALERLQRLAQTGINWAPHTRTLGQKPETWIPDEERTVFEIIDDLIDEQRSAHRPS